MNFLLIILLLLFLLLYPVIKAGFKVWMQMRQMNKEFSNKQQQYRNYNNYNKANDGRSSNRRSGKIFSSSDGEYVDFEEIIEPRPSVEYVEVRDAEPRISDVKYEEL